MYKKDKLTHPDMPPLNPSEFDQLRKDIIIPDVRNLDYSEFKSQIETHFKETTVNEWGCVPEYKSALEKELGPSYLGQNPFLGLQFLEVTMRYMHK